MIELAQLFQDMEAAVVQQEAPMQHIDDKAENTVTHVQQGNTQLDGAVTKARSARKKKWICLGIGRTYLNMASMTRNLLTLSKYSYSSSSSPQSSSAWLSRSETNKVHSAACITFILSSPLKRSGVVFSVTTISRLPSYPPSDVLRILGIRSWRSATHSWVIACSLAFSSCLLSPLYSRKSKGDIGAESSYGQFVG